MSKRNDYEEKCKKSEELNVTFSETTMLINSELISWLSFDLQEMRDNS